MPSCHCKFTRKLQRDHPFHRDTAMKWTKLGVYTVEVCFCSWWSLALMLQKCVFCSYVWYSYCRSMFSVVEVLCSWHGIVFSGVCEVWCPCRGSVFSTAEVWCSHCGSVFSVVHDIWCSCCGSVFCSSWCGSVFSVVYDVWCLWHGIVLSVVCEVCCPCWGSELSVVHDVWCSCCESVFFCSSWHLVFMAWNCVFCNL